MAEILTLTNWLQLFISLMLGLNLGLLLAAFRQQRRLGRLWREWVELHEARHRLIHYHAGDPSDPLHGQSRQT